MPAEEAAPQEQAAAKPKKRLPMILGIVGGMAVLQGVGFFVIFKSLGGSPEAAHGENRHAVEPAPASQAVTTVAEVSLFKGFRVPNDKTGRMWLYDLDVAVIVPSDQKERMEKLVEERGGELADCAARIVRSASSNTLREDDLSLLRSQLTQGFGEIIADDKLIQRVLIPRFVPLPM